MGNQLPVHIGWNDSQFNLVFSGLEQLLTDSENGFPISTIYFSFSNWLLLSAPRNHVPQWISNELEIGKERTSMCDEPCTLFIFLSSCMSHRLYPSSRKAHAVTVAVIVRLVWLTVTKLLGSKSCVVLRRFVKGTYANNKSNFVKVEFASIRFLFFGRYWDWPMQPAVHQLLFFSPQWTG